MTPTLKQMKLVVKLLKFQRSFFTKYVRIQKFERTNSITPIPRDSENIITQLFPPLLESLHEIENGSQKEDGR